MLILSMSRHLLFVCFDVRNLFTRFSNFHFVARTWSVHVQQLPRAPGLRLGVVEARAHRARHPLLRREL